MNDPLLPCPFCGGKADIIDKPNNSVTCGVKCTFCNASILGIFLPDIMIERWNIRVAPPPASMKWPEPGANIPKPFAADYTRGAIDGWNACLQQCKELNAVKGDHIVEVNEMVRASEKRHCQVCGKALIKENSFSVCPGCIEQPSEKKESDKKKYSAFKDKPSDGPSTFQSYLY